MTWPLIRSKWERRGACLDEQVNKYGIRFTGLHCLPPWNTPRHAPFPNKHPGFEGLKQETHVPPPKKRSWLDRSLTSCFARCPDNIGWKIDLSKNTADENGRAGYLSSVKSMVIFLSLCTV